MINEQEPVPPTHRALRVLASYRRQGSSWPLLIETESEPCFTKLRGAAEGTAALVAEIIVAGLAQALGLRVPRRALLLIDEHLVCEDGDAELADLLRASRGVNLGFQFLEGARDFRPGDLDRVGADEASTIVWLDWLVMNPDRTPRNPNLLIWKGDLWLIDHGAALVFHHDWPGVTEDSPRHLMFSTESHVLGKKAVQLAEWDPLLHERLDRDTVKAAVRAVPDDFLWPLLPRGASAGAPARRREAYSAFLWKRLKPPRPFEAAAPAFDAERHSIVLNSATQGSTESDYPVSPKELEI